MTTTSGGVPSTTGGEEASNTWEEATSTTIGGEASIFSGEAISLSGEATSIGCGGDNSLSGVVETSEVDGETSFDLSGIDSFISSDAGGEINFGGLLRVSIDCDGETAFGAEGTSIVGGEKTSGVG